MSFNIPACPCAQEASSTYPLSTLNASQSGSWPQVRSAARPVALGPPAAHRPQCACARQDRARHPQRPVTSPGSSSTFSFRRCSPYAPFFFVRSTFVSSSPTLFSVLVVSCWCVGAGRMPRISSGSFSRCSYRVICTKMAAQNTLPTLYSCLSPVESLLALHTIGVGVHLLQRREEPWRCTGSHLRLAPALLTRQES